MSILGDARNRLKQSGYSFPSSDPYGHYNRRRGIAKLRVPGLSQDAPVCPPGYHWDAAKNACVNDAMPEVTTAPVEGGDGPPITQAGTPGWDPYRYYRDNVQVDEDGNVTSVTVQNPAYGTGADETFTRDNATQSYLNEVGLRGIDSDAAAWESGLSYEQLIDLGHTPEEAAEIIEKRGKPGEIEGNVGRNRSAIAEDLEGLLGLLIPGAGIIKAIANKFGPAAANLPEVQQAASQADAGGGGVETDIFGNVIDRTAQDASGTDVSHASDIARGNVRPALESDDYVQGSATVNNDGSVTTTHVTDSGKEYNKTQNTGGGTTFSTPDGQGGYIVGNTGGAVYHRLGGRVTDTDVVKRIQSFPRTKKKRIVSAFKKASANPTKENNDKFWSLYLEEGGDVDGPINGASMDSHPGDPMGTDDVPAWLTEGEFIIDRDSTDKFRPLLEAINEWEPGDDESDILNKIESDLDNLINSYAFGGKVR